MVRQKSAVLIMATYTNPTLSPVELPWKPLLYIDDQAAIFTCTGSPEGVIVANTGSKAYSDNGLEYRKTTDGVNTGWVAQLDQSGAGAALIQNPTTNAIPYNDGALPFGDSPLWRSSATEVILGSGLSSATPPAQVRLTGTAGLGTDIATGDVTIAPPVATGAAVPGIIDTQLPLIRATGSTVQSLSSARPRPWLRQMSQWSNQVTIVSSTAETLFLAANPDFGNANRDIEAGFFRVGRRFKGYAKGTMGDTGTPTGRLRLYLGPTGTLLIADTGAITLVTIGGGCTWYAEFDFTVLTLGATGTIRLHRNSFDYGASNGGARVYFDSVPATVANVDSTGVNRIVWTWTWSASSASNTLTCEEFELSMSP